MEVFAFIAVENEPPYLTQVYLLDNDGDSVAARRWNRIMARFKECLESNHWPGYTDNTELTLPKRYYQQYAAEVV